LKIPQLQFSKYLKIPVQRINEIVKNKRGISPETACCFQRHLGQHQNFG
jgi:plasmid maintenance system antidote protein VapI